MKPRSIIIIVLVLILAGLIGLALFVYVRDVQEGKIVRPGETSGNPLFPTGENIPTGGVGNEFVDGNGAETNGGVGEAGNESRIQIERLAIISATPVTGAKIVETKEGSLVRYAESGTGHIYDTDPFLSVPKKIVNMTLPRVQRTSFSPDGKNILYQYATEDNAYIRSYLGSLIQSASSTNIVGQILPGTILDGLFTSTSLITLEENLTSATIYKTDLIKKGRTKLFESPISEWKLIPIDQNSIALGTKPLSGNREFLFSLNTNTKEVQKIATGRGLTAIVSPDGKKILRGEAIDGEMTLSLSDTGKYTYKSLDLATLPEKCVWAGDSVILYCLAPKSVPEEAALPDAWYKGLIAFEDSIYEINTLSGEKILLTQDNEERVFDGEYLELDTNDSYLVFRDKINGFLWRFVLPVREEE